MNAVTLSTTLVNRAWDYCTRNQQQNGSWGLAPLPRTLENGLAVVLLQSILPDATAASKRWLLSSGCIQKHHPVAEAIDTWLLGQLNDPSLALDVSSALFDAPVFAQRKRVFGGLSAALGIHARGWGAHRDQVELLEHRLRKASVNKAWSSAEDAALGLLLTSDPSLHERCITIIGNAQHENGSIAHNPISTMLVAYALGKTGMAQTVLEGAKRHLELAQHKDGTWRFATAEVWDTALMLRAFYPFADRTEFARGVDFLVRNQNTDGGFPYRPDVESDTDTTGMALMAVRYKVEMGKAVDYLRQRRSGDVWQTWNADSDPPAEDAVAHAVLGMRAHGCPGSELAGPEDWLASRLREESGWAADWYNIDSYACHEVGLALGRRSRAVRYATDQILGRQNADGGWGPHGNLPSTPAATSLAIGLASFYVESNDERVIRGLRFLLDQQTESGELGGPTDMYAPRPFAVDYPHQSHALSVIGPIALLAKASRPPADRRKQERVERVYQRVRWAEARARGPSGEGKPHEE